MSGKGMQRVVRWRGEEIPMLVLGTAQLGISGYGVANTGGEIEQERVDAIVMAAWESGVRFFDTAQSYGNSEERLGRALSRLGDSPDAACVITKPDLDKGPQDVSAVAAGLRRSLERLRVGHLWGVMLHRFSWLECWDKGLGDCLKHFRNEGGTKYLGVSVYLPEEALSAMAHPDLDIIQIPANSWDGRMVRAGVFEAAKENDKLLFVRSVFLQGLVLLPPEEAELKVPGAKIPAMRWQELCLAASCSPQEAALRWAAEFGYPLVVGAETPEQTVETARMLRFSGEAIDARAMNGIESETVINPSFWRR